MNNSSLFEERLQTLRELSNLFYPKSKQECLLFFTCFFGYLSFSLFFAFDTLLLDHPISQSDLILGFDNQYIFKRGYSNVTSHPFMAVFSMPIVYIGNILAPILGYKFKTVFVIVFCTYMIVQGQVIVRRYLSKIIGLNSFHCNLLAIFFAICASNLVLSMVFESFTFSFFFLCLMTYYYSHKLNTNQKLPLSIGLLFAFTIGGTTLSNLGKTLTPFFFEKIKLKGILTKQFAISSVFIIAFGLFSTMLMHFFKRNRIIDIFNRYEKYTDSPLTFFETVQASIGGFFGAPMLLTDFEVVPRALPNGPYTIQIPYDTIWQYGFAICILAMLLISIFYNRKNRLVLFITLNLCFDLALHIFLQYGLEELFIFAGHWIFAFPILIGWLLKKQQKIGQKFLVGLLMVLCIVAASNNGIRLFQLYQFGLEYHGA